MGNKLFSEKQKDGGYLYMEERENQIFLEMSKLLFKQNYTIDLESIKNLQTQNGNTSLEILSVHVTPTTYVIQLPSYKKDTSLSIHNLRQLQNRLQGNQLDGLRILPLFEDIYIVLEGVDNTMQEYIMSNQFPSTQIQGYVSNANLVEFLIDQEISEKHTQLVTPQNVKEISENLFTDPNKNRLHFQNIRSYGHVRKVCAAAKAKFEDDPNLLQQIQSIVFDNSDSFNYISEQKLIEFNDITQTFSHAKEFFIRNMDISSKKKQLQNNFIPYLRNMSQLKTLDISGNNISEFNLESTSNLGDSNHKTYTQADEFQFEEEESKDRMQKKQSMQEEEQTENDNSDNDNDSFVFEQLRTLCLNTNAFLTSQNIESVFYSKALSRIEELYLINNRIGQVQIDDSRFNLKNLTYLNFTANKINNTSSLAIFTSESLRCLKKLVLRCNDIQRIVENTDQCTLSNLEYLDLTRNKIESDHINLIFCSGALSNLKELIIHMNSKITDFPSVEKQSFKLSKLNNLNLSKNSISTQGFLQLVEFLPSSIEHLNLNSNKIALSDAHNEVISHTFASHSDNCTLNMKILQLKSNTITDSESIFNYFRQVRILDLSHNLIRNVNPPELRYLFKLDISHNQIESTEELFSKLHLSSYLTLLNASNNNIKTIIKHTYGSIPLTHLDLSFNQVSDISSQIFFSCTNFSSLKHLNLSFNSITHPVISNNLNNLQKLHLAANKITDQGNTSYFHLDNLYQFNKFIYSLILNFYAFIQ